MQTLTQYIVAVVCFSFSISLLVLSRETPLIVIGSAVSLYILFGHLSWMCQYLLHLVNANLRLCIVWAVILTVMLPLVFEGLGPRQQHVSQVRKFFHLVAVILFLPPLRQTKMIVAEFVCAAGISMIGLFVVLESIRITKKPFSHNAKHFLFKLVTPFLDAKDKRARFVSSHIQLLAACVLPPAVLITTHSFPNELVSLSGVLSVGIGDAAAALGGMLCGGIYSLPWNRRKTLPGLVAFVLSVLAALKALGLLSMQSVIATAITALVETTLATYDNLVLPLVFSLVVVAYELGF